MSDLVSEATESWLLESLVLVPYLKEFLGEVLGESMGEPIRDILGEALGEPLGELLLNHEPLKELLGDCSCLSLELSVKKDDLEEAIDIEVSTERKKQLELEAVGTTAGSISGRPMSSSVESEKQSNVLLERTEESLSLPVEEEKGEGNEKSPPSAGFSLLLSSDGVEGG